MNNSLKGGFAADDLKNDLIEKIKSGELQPGEKILSERKLAAAYGISYMTVRRAIDSLAKQGYVSREPHHRLCRLRALRRSDLLPSRLH